LAKVRLKQARLRPARRGKAGLTRARQAGALQTGIRQAGAKRPAADRVRRRWRGQAPRRRADPASGFPPDPVAAATFDPAPDFAVEPAGSQANSPGEPLSCVARPWPYPCAARIFRRIWSHLSLTFYSPIPLQREGRDSALFAIESRFLLVRDTALAW